MRSAADATVDILDRTTVELVGIKRAFEVSPHVDRRRFLHAGPPLSIEEVPGPMRGALIGALIFEGEARTEREARKIIAAGEIELSPCHEAGGVGAMAGIVTPNMPVVVVKASSSVTAFSPLNEGLGQALRFGSYDEATLDRLVWLRDIFGPLLDSAIQSGSPIEITEVQAEGLRRGDECHNRNVASSAVLLLRLAADVIKNAKRSQDAADVMTFVLGNRHFFLPFSMAACKAIAQSAAGIRHSPVVTAICANGERLGIRVSGCGDRWFTTASPIGSPRLFEGYTLEDAQPTMGDSFITECLGLGAFSLSAAPAIASFIGGSPSGSAARVAGLRTICHGTSTRFLLPYEDFAGAPIGIDVGRIAATGRPPLANNGLAHREPGRGQVGAGLTELPLEPFLEALDVLREGMRTDPRR